LTWFASLGLAWFDTCADGWAIDVASEKEESAFQAAMVGGKALGLILMSGAFGFLGMRYGFGAIFRLLVYLTAIVAVAVFFARYTPRTQNQAEVTGLKGLRNKSFLIFALFGVVYSIASFGMDGLVTLFLSETRLISPIELGIFGMNRGAGALLGAATYVVVLRKSSSRFAQTLALTVLGVGCLIPLLPLPTGFMGTLWGFAWGFQETAFVTLAMKHSKGPWAASVFALCMIFSNVGTAIGEALGSPLVPLLGFSGVFLGFAIVAWASLALVHKLFPARN
jgi:predicted MFS family arabinose efflux permease